LGAWFNRREWSGQIMVIVHKGRKSGKTHRTPVNYAIQDGDVYCTAGFGGGSDWYKNIIANPQVEVWLPEGWWAGVAESVIGHERQNELMRQVLIASGFAARVAGIDPAKMTDEQLAQTCSRYPLVRIRRATPCTGSGGPGDLAWIWPLATFVLLPLALRRRRR
jgi:deazaflavin-dependent oxidoreductase (nitroreductase family)